MNVYSVKLKGDKFWGLLGGKDEDAVKRMALKRYGRKVIDIRFVEKFKKNEKAKDKD